MDEKITGAVLAELEPLFEEQGFVKDGDCYKNEQKAFKIDYNGEKSLFELLCADITDGKIADFSVSSSYLFEEGSKISDATAVGIDFADTLRSTLGINTRKTRSASEVSLPSKGNSETPGMGDLCQKVLAIFPKYKEDYKDHMTKYGELLYVDFLLNTAAVGLRELLREGTDKKIKKTFDALNELYVKGNRTVGDVIVVVIIGGAIQTDPVLRDKALDCLSDFTYLKTAVRSLCARTPKDKKLKELYGI